MTKIPYLDEVWNPTSGCSHCSPGCDRCWAERMFSRHLWKCRECEGGQRVTPSGYFECPTCNGTGYQDFTPRFHPERLDQPLHWRKPRVVGVSFMGDLFHEGISEAQRDGIFAVMALASRHTFVVLTKRPDEALRYIGAGDTPELVNAARHRVGRHIEEEWTRAQLLTVYARPDNEWDLLDETWPLPNTLLGVTVCNQAEADEKIPILLATPAAKRWVSIEPMLSAVSLFGHDPYALHHGLDWIVCGGETGPGARPMEPQWALDVYRQCKAAGVPFYWKQWGDWYRHRYHRGLTLLPEYVEMVATHEFPEVTR